MVFAKLQGHKKLDFIMGGRVVFLLKVLCRSFSIYLCFCSWNKSHNESYEKRHTTFKSFTQSTSMATFFIGVFLAALIFMYSPEKNYSNNFVETEPSSALSSNLYASPPIQAREDLDFVTIAERAAPAVVKITAEESGGRVNRLDVWIYLIQLDNIGSFPEAGITEIIVKRIDYIPDDTGSSVSSNIQDQDYVYLYAIVDGVYQQLTLDFEVSGSFSLYQHTVITEIQVYDT